MKQSRVRIKRDTERHKKGEEAYLVGNPGRGAMSAYVLRFDDGDEEIVPPVPSVWFQEIPEKIEVGQVIAFPLSEVAVGRVVESTKDHVLVRMDKWVNVREVSLADEAVDGTVIIENQYEI
jgi:hypothetical protein